MNKMLVVVFGSEEEARAGDRALKELHDEGRLTVYAAAIIAKADDGQVKVVEMAHDQYRNETLSPFVGALVGLLGGSLVALSAGALAVPAGVLVGATGGGFLSLMLGFVKVGGREDFANEVAGFLQPGGAAVVADMDEDQILPLDSCMESLNGTIFRQPRTPTEWVLIEQELGLLGAEIVARRAEIEGASGDNKVKLETKIADAKAKLGAKIEQVESLEIATQRVANFKVKSLEEQIATGRDPWKRGLQERIASVQIDYDERVSKLKQARQKAQVELAG